MFFEESANVIKMNEQNRKICINITKQMMEYPCAKVFLEPMEPGELDVIKSPQDLTSILSRLENSSYQTVDVWEQDVSSIWYNAEKYYGSQSFMFILASALCKRFNKLKTSLDIQKFESWTKHYFELEAKIYTLTKSPPEQFKEYVPASLIEETVNEPFTEKDLSALEKALKALQKPNDLNVYYNVLRRYMPKIDIHAEPVSVDIREFPNQALHRLKKYAMKRHQEIGKPYPS